MLVLTDHLIHKAYDSLYPFLVHLHQHQAGIEVEVASRANPANLPFFEELKPDRIYTTLVGRHFNQQGAQLSLSESRKRVVGLADFDLVLLRLPRPLSQPLFEMLMQQVEAQRLVNYPAGILRTGTKAFLTEIAQLCPPLQLCYSTEEILSFAKNFPIVLKPLHEAGGRGILKIEQDEVWEGQHHQPLQAYLPELHTRAGQGYLAMKYLKRVSEGDKRIFVVNGKVVAAALRLPPPNTWMCNVAMGGNAVAAEADEDEMAMAQVLSPLLKQNGIIIYGFDTLMGDDGHRVLSEINVSCPGGLYPAELLAGKPYTLHAANEFANYITQHIAPK